jgi:phospholipase A-2-activating protein
MSVTVLNSEDLHFVSVGEDGSVVIWKNGAMQQSIPHPSGLWCVYSLGNGDFITGAHDGNIRMFSSHSQQTHTEAAQALQVAFEVEVQDAIERKHKGPSEEDLRKAPVWETAANRPGTSEAQVCVFNKQGKLIAAQWSTDSRTWVEMGEVVGNSGDSELVNGVHYDVVLPVELDTATGPASLKLGTLTT